MDFRQLRYFVAVYEEGRDDADDEEGGRLPAVREGATGKVEAARADGAKVVVIDTRSGAEIAGDRRSNPVLRDGIYPHYDVEMLWSFILASLRQFAQEPGFDAISITTHGASAALLDENGDLAMPVLDYEHSYPVEIREAYLGIRPDFSETGSPSLLSLIHI